ncbi:dihydrodipicolinate synthase family protein [Shinella sp. S4-D37]|uniref:dihydrodipicolinate synthase family protein n=1 Tax=Shinella sp. S4-D37 TaxID=3161999 RepID=UPI0034658449
MPPILLYEIPYRTRFSMQPEIIHELSRHERIIGMKVCNTDMFHFLQILAGVDASFAVLSGEDTLFPLHIAAGAPGGMIVLPTLLPKAWRQIFDLASTGKTTEALARHREFIPLIKMAFAETNPGPIKAVMDLIGVDSPELLAPLVPPAQSLREPLRAEVKRLLAKFESGCDTDA